MLTGTIPPPRTSYTSIVAQIINFVNSILVLRSVLSLINYSSKRMLVLCGLTKVKLGLYRF